MCKPGKGPAGLNSIGQLHVQAIQFFQAEFLSQLSLRHSKLKYL